MNPVFLLLGAFLLVTQDVSQEALRRHVTKLASDELGGRCAGKPGAKEAVRYIIGQWKASGIAPFSGKFEQPISITSFSNLRVRVKSANVLAVIPGKDPELRSEFIVLGAHYDGPGQKGDPNAIVRIGSSDRSDQVWNGADDNASGVAALLEAGRVLSTGNLKRSVLLVAFGGEEFGSIGSIRFLQALPRSGEREPFSAMVNLHMLGRGKRSVTVLSTRTSKEWQPLAEAAAQDLIPLRCPREISDTGDQASFYGRKIPAVQVFGGFHEFMHTPGDETDKIDFPLLEVRTRFVIRLVRQLANLEERLSWTGPPAPPGVGFHGSDVSDLDAESMGLSPGQGAVSVLDVVPGEAAARAGIKVGDVILRFGEVTLSREGAMVELRDAIRESRKRARVPVRVLRGTKEIELEIVWLDR